MGSSLSSSSSASASSSSSPSSLFSSSSSNSSSPFSSSSSSSSSASWSSSSKSSSVPRRQQKPFPRVGKGFHIRRLIAGGPFYHHGICVDDCHVVSFYDDSKVKLETLEEFAQGHDIEIVNKDKCRGDLKTIAKRAEDYYRNQNYGQYQLWENNCEHFATACIGGRSNSQSKQSEDPLAEIRRHVSGMKAP